MRRVLTTGTFDIPHAGHASFLRQASGFAERLIIGVLSDSFVERYKGKAPLYNQSERALLVEAMTGSDAYVISDQRKFFLSYGVPDSTVIVVGSDWARKDYYQQIGMSQAELDHQGFVLAYIPYTEGISTSGIQKRTLENKGADPSGR